jgi:6,7-dimethyl-8-ribityllumazine synthase
LFSNAASAERLDYIMLKPVKTKSQTAKGFRFAIIASKYNSIYVEGMLRHAQETLARAGADHVSLIRVPGAFEIPAVTAKLAHTIKPRFSALICLGVILRGATTHAQHIGEAVTDALAEIQVTFQTPVIHEVLLLENDEQARARCLSREHNRGAEAAQTAIEMAQTMSHLSQLVRVNWLDSLREPTSKRLNSERTETSRRQSL